MTSRRLAILICSLLWGQAILPAVSGAVIAEWNFNSPGADADSATGTTSVARGDGTFTVVGEVRSEFGDVGGGSTTDPVESDNSQIRLSSFPSIDAGNQTAGVEFTINTSGFEKIALAWDQYNSATASRYWRVQYTRDGFEWFDHALVTNTVASKWTRFAVSLADTTRVNDRPYLGLRLVQEFESTATGAGLDQYVAVGEGRSYSRSGTCWLDMVTITGRVIGTTNEVPKISLIPDVETIVGETSEAIEVTVSDLETASDQLTLTAISSAPEVASTAVEGQAGKYEIILRSLGPGEASVTVRVTDEEGDFAETSFRVTVQEEEIGAPPPFFLLWDFNGAPADDDATTGSVDGAQGAGLLQVIGTDNSTFGTVGQGASSDPAETDNSMLRISSFPEQGTGDATSGIEFFGSTAGFREIDFVWDQYNSGSASRYWQVHYTTNGTDFIAYTMITNTSASRWQRALTVSFRDVPGAGNNPLFGVRLVASFAPGGANYEPVSAANYSAAGTLWLDMVGLTGERLTGPEANPELRITVGDGVQISWPATATAFDLESKHPTGDWVSAEGEISNGGGEFHYRVEPLDEGRWFRLRQRPVF